MASDEMLASLFYSPQSAMYAVDATRPLVCLPAAGVRMSRPLYRGLTSQ
jgi:hypothetical protein